MEPTKYFIRDYNTNWNSYAKDEYRIILHIENKYSIFSFNRNAFIIWILLDGKTPLSSICSKLEIARGPLNSFLTYLSAHQLGTSSAVPLLNSKCNISEYYPGLNYSHESQIKYKLINSNLRSINALTKKEWRQIYRTKTNNHLFFPPRATLDINYYCTQECKHCYIQKTENELPSPVIINKIIKRLAESGVKMIGFIGGEPLNDCNLPSYIELASKLNMETVVYTNGLHPLGSNIKCFQQNNVLLAVSLEHYNSKKHDFIRGEGSYDQTIAFIINSIKNNIKTTIRVTSTRNNYLSGIRFLFFAQKYNVQGIYLCPIVKISPKNFKHEVDLKLFHIIALLVMNKICFILSKTPFFSVKYEFPENYRGCASQYTLSLDFSGNVKFCAKFAKDYNFGNIFKRDIVEIWNSMKLNELKRPDNIRSTHICHSCLFWKICLRPLCLAEAYTTHNDPLAGDIQCVRGMVSKYVLLPLLGKFKKK